MIVMLYSLSGSNKYTIQMKTQLDELARVKLQVICTPIKS